LVGAVTVRPLEVRLNVRHLNRWFMSNAWVTEPRAMRLTLVRAATAVTAVPAMCEAFCMVG
jgi:hypothetical protein